MKFNTKYTIGLCMVVGFLFWGCANKEQPDEEVLSDEQQESVEVRPEVLFTVADSLPVYQYVESRGVVRAARKVALKPKISGFVAASNIAGGRWVSEDELLLQFEKLEWLYALQEAENKYQQALSKYKIEKRLRSGALQSSGTNGADTTSNDKMIRRTTGLTAAKLALKRAKLNLSYTTMHAPFSGCLATQQRIAEGSYVTAGTKIATLVNDAAVRVHFDVLEAELAKIEEGMAADIITPAGRVMEGTVTAISPVVNTKTKTGEVIVTVQNPNGWLRSGMTVEGRIHVKKQESRARIPRAAVLSRAGGRTLIFKLHPGNNEVQWIYVDPVAVNSEWALINHPEVAPGDTIAVDNHFALSHLQIVDPKMRLLQREDESGELRE